MLDNLADMLPPEFGNIKKIPVDKSSFCDVVHSVTLIYIVLDGKFSMQVAELKKLMTIETSTY